MITNQPTVIQNWFTGQVVTQADMRNMSFDTYNKNGVLSDNVFPCIYSGGEMVVSGLNIDVSAGVVRCNDQPNAYLPNQPLPGIFSFPDTSLVFPLVGDGLIVAVISIAPVTPNEILYTFSGTVQLLANGVGYTPATMVILGSYTSAGVINYETRDNDYSNLQSLLNAHKRNYISTNNYQMLPTDGNVIIPATAIGITGIKLPIVANLPDVNMPLTFNITNLNAVDVTITTSDTKTILLQTSYLLYFGCNITAYYSIADDTWLFK